MIRAVLFDVDGVLVHPWRWQEQLIQKYGITPAMTRPFFTGPFAECAAGRADVLDVLPPFLETWGWPESPRSFVEQWCVAEHAPDSEVLAIVEELRRRGVKCFVASTQERHRAHYLATVMAFEHQFDGLFFSCDIGSAKPQREFFTAIAEQLSIAPHELLFFDDVAGHVQGARDCGWIAETYVGVADLRRQIGAHLGGTLDIA
jgi:putative hydrolase of the HAD superfamily